MPQETIKIATRRKMSRFIIYNKYQRLSLTRIDIRPFPTSIINQKSWYSFTSPPQKKVKEKVHNKAK